MDMNFILLFLVIAKGLVILLQSVTLRTDHYVQYVNNDSRFRGEIGFHLFMNSDKERP